MRAVLSALVFPTVFGGALTVTWALLHADVARPLVVALVMAGAALAVTILERLLPFERAWSRSHGDLKTDLVYATVSLFAAPRLFDAVLLSAMVAAGDWLTGQLGSHLWPAALPWAAQVALAEVKRANGADGPVPASFLLEQPRTSSPRPRPPARQFRTCFALGNR